MSNQKAKYRVNKIISTLISGGFLLQVMGPAFAAIPEGTTNGASSIAIGTGSTSGSNSIAAGTGAVGGTNGVAVGNNASAGGIGDQNTAVGNSATASGGTASSLGASAQANGSGTTALGSRAAATATGATSVGTNSKASATNDSAFGSAAEANGGFSGGATAVGNTARATASGASAVGLLSTASGDRSSVFGTGATSSAADALSLGGFSSSTGQRSAAIGYRASSSLDDSVAIGSNSITTGAVSVFGQTLRGQFYSIAGGSSIGVASIGTATSTRQLKGVSAGSAPTDAVNKSQLDAAYTAIDSIVTGGAATPNPYVKFSSTLPAANAVGQDTSAVGPSAFASGAEGSAYGSQAGAVGVASTAVGARAAAIGDNTTVIGAGAFSDVANSVVLGNGSLGVAAVGNANTTIRGVTYGLAGTVPAGSVSVGSVGSERQIKNVAAGNSPTDGANVSQVNAVRQAVENLALGGSSAPTPFVKFNSDEVDAQAIGNNTSAVGPAAQAIGDNSTALGALSVAQAENSLALGTRATALHANSVAIGNDSVTQEALSSPGMTIRGNAYTFAGSTPAGSVAVGSQGQERTIQHVAAGVRDTDAVNMSQFNSLAGEVNNLVVGGSGPATTVVNNYNNVVNNQAPFFNAKSTAADSQANGNESISVGGGAVANSENSIAIGGRSSTNGASAVALGYGSSATGNRSVALGAGTTATRDNEVNVGSRTVGGVANAQYADQAVNLGQMEEGDRAAVSEANSYTDARSAQTLQQSNSYTDQQFGKAKKLAHSAAAMGMAASGIVMSPDSEKAMGVGVAAVNGSPAVALRFSWRSKTDRRTTFNVTGAAARGMVGVAGAINWQWE